jgi:hypothetical protein
MPYISPNALPGRPASDRETAFTASVQALLGICTSFINSEVGVLRKLAGRGDQTRSGSVAWGAAHLIT